MDIRALLAELKTAGASRAKVEMDAATGAVTALEVEFAPEVPLATGDGNPFVDKDGNPIDLDAGLPDLAHDPIAKRYAALAKKTQAS